MENIKPNQEKTDLYQTYEKMLETINNDSDLEHLEVEIKISSLPQAEKNELVKKIAEK